MRHMIESVSMINMRVLHIFGVVSLSHGNLHRVTSNVYTQRCRVGAVESSSIVLSIYDYRRRCPFLCVLNPHSHGQIRRHRAGFSHSGAETRDVTVR